MGDIRRLYDSHGLKIHDNNEHIEAAAKRIISGKE
jgi:hypothetical protein